MDSFFDLFKTALSSAANGYGNGLAGNNVAGRTPTPQQLTNPTQPNTGSAGQPGTVPAVISTGWAQAMPYVIIGGVVLGVALLFRLLRK